MQPLYISVEIKKKMMPSLSETTVTMHYIGKSYVTTVYKCDE